MCLLTINSNNLDTSFCGDGHFKQQIQQWYLMNHPEANILLKSFQFSTLEKQKFAHIELKTLLTKICLQLMGLLNDGLKLITWKTLWHFLLEKSVLAKVSSSVALGLLSLVLTNSGEYLRLTSPNDKTLGLNQCSLHSLREHRGQAVICLLVGCSD
uniref:Uncharacterized protein n=1 Tax=Molossus molossus TaxID=27622 RepID=A0A7J8JWV1_MOLMO|nr:hypothetical protein HJG59_007973 [Molossus molossus]